MVIVAVMATLAASCTCSDDYPTCGGEREIIVRFEDDTSEEQNKAVIAEAGDTILRQDRPIHYFLLRTDRCAESAFEPYEDRDDVRYYLFNFCASFSLAESLDALVQQCETSVRTSGEL